MIDDKLAGQVAVVTGAARGIGFETCRRLGREGAAIAMIDMEPAALAASARVLKSEGLKTLTATADVSDPGSVRLAFEQIRDAWSRIDILVNNAGVFPRIDFKDLTYEAWQRIFAINCSSVFLCTRAAYPVMVAQNYGRIVNLSSSTVFIGPPRRAAYVASKAAIIGLSRSLATEFGRHGITVNVVCPGLVATEGAAVEDPQGQIFDRIVPLQAIGRRGAPTDIAEAIAYLTSPGSGFVTGQVINVDGGHRFP